MTDMTMVAAQKGFLGISIGRQEQTLIDNEIDKRKESVLNKYENMMRNGTVIPEITFPQSVRDIGIFKYENGVEIRMPIEELFPDGGEQYGLKSFHARAHYYTNRAYAAKVIAVDRDNSRVTVSYAKAQEAYRPAVEKEIQDALDRGEGYRTKARVTYVCRQEGSNYGRYLICDICGLGIPGILFCYDWTKGFVDDLTNCARPDDIIDVVVYARNKAEKKSTAKYRVSRAKALDFDPWEEVERVAPLHSTANVRIYRTNEGYCLGKIDGLNELTAYCYYPKPMTISSVTGRPFAVRVGGTYSGYVATVDRETKKLRIRILDEIIPGREAGEGKG